MNFLWRVVCVCATALRIGGGGGEGEGGEKGRGLGPYQRRVGKGKYRVRDPVQQLLIKIILVGDTGRQFITRLSEHQKDAKNVL